MTKVHRVLSVVDQMRQYNFKVILFTNTNDDDDDDEDDHDDNDDDNNIIIIIIIIIIIVDEKVEEWVAQVPSLAEFATTQPQSSYVAFVFGLTKG